MLKELCIDFGAISHNFVSEVIEFPSVTSFSGTVSVQQTVVSELCSRMLILRERCWFKRRKTEDLVVYFRPYLLGL
jgi:hypothetical protein